MKNSLPDLQVGNITHTNILATVRLVAQFCVAVHKEYQCLRREVRSLRAESRSLAEKIAQQSCNATGDGPSIGTVVELPHRAVINRSDSDFSENNNSFDSGASGVNNSGGDETTCVDASESGAEMELPEDVHDNGASKSLSTDSNVHASTGDNDVSSEGTVCEMLDGKDTPKKSTGHNKVHAVSSGKRVKRRLLQDCDSDEENESTAKDGDVTISEVCQEISKTLEDDEQSNSSSFVNWSPVFKLQKEAPQCVVSKAQCSYTERETGQAGSAPKSGRITKSKSGSKAVRLVAKSCNSQKSKSPYNDDMQRDSDDEYEATKRLKTAGSHRKPPRRQSTGQLTKTKAFLRIKIKAKKSTTRKCEQKQTARSKDVNSRKRKSLPAGRIGINADADDTDQGDTDEEPSDTSPVVRRHSTDVHISNCRVVIEDDISPQALAAAKKRCKLTEKQKAAHPGPRDLGDESNSNMVVELLDVGFLWQLSKLLTRMLDEGQASLTFSAANITNYARLNLAKNLCQRTLFKWDDDTKTIKRLRSSRHPGARDMERILRRIRPK